jgi:hypothetical protein
MALFARHLRFVSDTEDTPLSSSEEDWQIFGLGIDALRNSVLNTHVNNQIAAPDMIGSEGGRGMSIIAIDPDSVMN